MVRGFKGERFRVQRGHVSSRANKAWSRVVGEINISTQGYPSVQDHLQWSPLKKSWIYKGMVSATVKPLDKRVASSKTYI